MRVINHETGDHFYCEDHSFSCTDNSLKVGNPYLNCDKIYLLQDYAQERLKEEMKSALVKIEPDIRIDRSGYFKKQALFERVLEACRDPDVGITMGTSTREYRNKGKEIEA